MGWTINILEPGNKQRWVGDNKGAEDCKGAYSKLAKAAATLGRGGTAGPMMEKLVSFSYIVTIYSRECSSGDEVKHCSTTKSPEHPIGHNI